MNALPIKPALAKPGSGHTRFHDPRSRHQIALYLTHAIPTTEQNARNLKRWTPEHARRWYERWI